MKNYSFLFLTIIALACSKDEEAVIQDESFTKKTITKVSPLVGEANTLVSISGQGIDDGSLEIAIQMGRRGLLLSTEAPLNIINYDIISGQIKFRIPEMCFDCSITVSSEENILWEGQFDYRHSVQGYGPRGRMNYRPFTNANSTGSGTGGWTYAKNSIFNMYELEGGLVVDYVWSGDGQSVSEFYNDYSNDFFAIKFSGIRTSGLKRDSHIYSIALSKDKEDLYYSIEYQVDENLYYDLYQLKIPLAEWDSQSLERGELIATSSVPFGGDQRNKRSNRTRVMSYQGSEAFVYLEFNPTTRLYEVVIHSLMEPENRAVFTTGIAGLVEWDVVDSKIIYTVDSDIYVIDFETLSIDKLWSSDHSGSVSIRLQSVSALDNSFLFTEAGSASSDQFRLLWEYSFVDGRFQVISDQGTQKICQSEGGFLFRTWHAGFDVDIPSRLSTTNGIYFKGTKGGHYFTMSSCRNDAIILYRGLIF